MSPAYAVEALKLRRSRVVLVATLALALVPAAMARGFLAAVFVTWPLGLATGLGMPDDGDWQTLGRVATLAVLSGLLALPVAVAASRGRGYLPAVGGLLVLVILAQVATIAGAGGWWPWSVPAMWAIGPEAGIPAVTAARLLVVPAVALAGAVVTLRWWRHADVV